MSLRKTLLALLLLLGNWQENYQTLAAILAVSAPQSIQIQSQFCFHLLFVHAHFSITHSK